MPSEKKWCGEFSEAHEAFSEGRHAEANARFTVLLEYAAKHFTPTDPRLAAVHQGLGETCDALGQTADAEKHFKCALVCFERKLGASNLQTLKMISALGSFYRRTANYAQSEIFLSKALHGLEQIPGLAADELVEPLSQLAGLYTEINRLKEAEAILARIVAIRDGKALSERPDTTLTLVNFADQQISRRRYGEAEVLLLEVLQIKEQALGNNHADVASLLMRLGDLAVLDCRHEDAVPYYERALLIREESFDYYNSDVAASARALGGAYLAANQIPKAAQCFERALRIAQRLNGMQSLEVASDMHRLTIVYSLPGTYEKAEKYALAALKIREELLGAHHPNVITILKDLADICAAEGREDDAHLYDDRAKAALKDSPSKIPSPLDYAPNSPDINPNVIK